LFTPAVVPEENNAKTSVHFSVALSTYSSLVEDFWQSQSSGPTSSGSVQKLWIPKRCHFQRETAGKAMDLGVPLIFETNLSQPRLQSG
jgi:hypothetical protein